MTLGFYHIDAAYCDFLRKYDNRVPQLHARVVERPFVGIVLQINEINYYAPLTSPKPKHKQMKNQIDFLKINNGDWGAINFNNMIPAPASVLSKVDLRKKEHDSIQDRNYKDLLANQLSWCVSHRDDIYRRAEKLYRTIVEKRGDDRVKNRCCDFAKLECAYTDYCSQV